MSARRTRPVVAVGLVLAVAGIPPGVAIAAGDGASAPACRARVRLDPPRAVVGQQVLYRVRITSRDDVESVEWESLPSFPSLRSEMLPGDPQPAQAEPAPGHRVRDERRALFAEAPGRYRLEAPPLRCHRAGGGLEVATVPAAVLEVVPPPASGRPAGYDGLVGPLGIHTTVTPRELSLGESLRVAVMLRGQGNLWVLAPPYTAASFPGSELFPRRPQQDLDRGRRLSLRRHFVWDVVPRSEGTLRVPGLALPYFDPQRGEYAVARSEAVDVRVRARPAAALPAPARAPRPGAPAGGRGVPVGGTRVWLAAALLAAALVAAWGWRRRARASGSASARVPAAAPGQDEATRLDRALRAALARHVEDAGSVTPQELIAREPRDPAVASAAHLLAALERARFDPQAPPPDAAAVQRAIGSL